MTKDYTHDLGTEVRSISGGYCLDTELTVELDGEDVLVAVGNAAVDSSCCGYYGCRFAIVAGYVKEWKYRVNADGAPVTRVEPIADEQARKRIAVDVQLRTGVSQVQFW
jgi:hypothetical protein